MSVQHCINVIQNVCVWDGTCAWSKHAVCQSALVWSQYRIVDDFNKALHTYDILK